MYRTIERISIIDWQKDNPSWNNGIIVNGSVQLSHATQQLMINEIKKVILEGEE